MSACAGCGGPLDEGFLEDSGESSKGYTRWIPGPIEKGLFGGARRFGKDRIDVTAYRCQSCGLLSLYAGGSPDWTARSRSQTIEGPQDLTPPAPSPFGPNPDLRD